MTNATCHNFSTRPRSVTPIYRNWSTLINDATPDAQPAVSLPWLIQMHNLEFIFFSTPVSMHFKSINLHQVALSIHKSTIHLEVCNPRNVLNNKLFHSCNNQKRDQKNNLYPIYEYVDSSTEWPLLPECPTPRVPPKRTIAQNWKIMSSFFSVWPPSRPGHYCGRH